MNKKGQFTAFLPYIFVGIIVVFIFAISVIPIAYTGDKIFDELNKSNNFGGYNASRDAINSVNGFMIPAFDQIVFFTFIAIFIGTMVIAIFTDFHPVAIGIFILSGIILVVIAGSMTNIYDEVSDTSILTSIAQQFTFTNVLMGEHLPIFIGATVIFAILLILAKRGGATAPV